MTKSVSYTRGAHKIRVKIHDPRDTCIMCQHKFTGRRINTHHWKYEYTFDEVREDKERVLHNTSKLCVKHHRIANDLREIVDWYQRDHFTVEGFKRLVESMPVDMQESFMELIDTLK